MPLATLPPAPAHSSRMGHPRHRRSVTLPTKLPQLTPRSTMVSPIISDLKPTRRINVLHPPSAPRRTVALETGESHFHLHRRTIVMQQQQWMRQHGQWQKFMYGTPAVKEDYRSNIRESLKTQMVSRRRMRNAEWREAVRESTLVSQKDYDDTMEDALKRREKFHFLFGFTKANKEIMEAQWKKRREDKAVENRRDAEQLMYNPINWSHTLK